ncbi:MAG: alpha/beta hydrolase [Litoreibacter sp.]
MTIEFSTRGHGPVRLVVLHGWLSDKSVYTQIAPLFDETKYTLAFMDLRGYGASRALTGDYSIEEIARDALSVADQLDWDEFHVMGHSMGGIVLQKMALVAPDRILSGIAITPAPASGFEMDDDTAQFFESSATNDAALAEIFNILTGQRHAKAFLSQLTHECREKTTTPAYLGYLVAWTKADFADDVAEIEIPICVIAGKHDGAVGPDQMSKTYLTQLPNAHMEVIEAAGHYPMLETPPELFNIIEKFLANQTG